MVSLVTGGSGFIASHLVDHLLARGDEVVTVRRKPGAMAAPPSRGGGAAVTAYFGDVLDTEFLNRVLAETQPGEIYHLAAQSLPNVSWERPWATHETNVAGTLNVFRAVADLKLDATIVLACSSSEYAQSEQPIREDDPMSPSSPYGVSKLAADHLARLYAEKHGLRIVRARPFFWIGPRKTGDVTSDWARSIVAVERGAASELAVGNLDVVRDFIDVRDGVEALTLLARSGGAGGAYNISSGQGTPLEELLRALCALARTRVAVRVDPARVRPVDERVKVGDSSKLRALGWSPRRQLSETLRETLEYWRAG